jgi:hypothetical protein
MLPDTGIDDVKKQRNAEYAKHTNDPVLSSLKMEGIRLLFILLLLILILLPFSSSSSFKCLQVQHVFSISLHPLLKMALQVSGIPFA